MDHNTLHNFLSNAFVIACGIYLGAGLLFAIPFALFGVQKIDSHAAHTGWGFRFLIIPGATFLWPLLLRRWIRNLPPFSEKTAHRV